MAGHSERARHSIAEARALLQQAQAHAKARTCPHRGTVGRCRLCVPDEPVRRGSEERVDRYLVDAP